MTQGDHRVQLAVGVLDLPMALVGLTGVRQWFRAYPCSGIHGALPKAKFGASVELAFCVFDPQPHSAQSTRGSSWIHNHLTLLISTS